MTNQGSETPASTSHILSQGASAPFRQIVVGYDESEASHGVIQAADAIAKEFGSHLLVLHSLAPIPATLGVVGQPAESIPLHANEVQSRIRQDLRKLGLASPFRVLVAFDPPVEALIQVAKEHAADLLIVGTRGRYGIEQLLLGSVSQSLAGRVDCPVLILGPEFNPRANLFQTILFATDLDQTGVGAAQYASQLAEKFYCDLILMHVINKKPHAEGRMREWVEDNTSNKLNSLIDPEVLGDCNHRTLIAYGEAAQEILAAADSKRADLIVLGARKAHFLNDHASWSTLTEVVRYARCPVLVVGS